MNATYSNCAGRRVPFAFLEAVKKDFKPFKPRVATAIAYALNREFSVVLQRQMVMASPLRPTILTIMQMHSLIEIIHQRRRWGKVWKRAKGAGLCQGGDGAEHWFVVTSQRVSPLRASVLPSIHAFMIYSWFNGTPYPNHHQERVLERGERLDLLVDKTEDLQANVCRLIFVSSYMANYTSC